MGSRFLVVMGLAAVLCACGPSGVTVSHDDGHGEPAEATMKDKLSKYTPFKLTAELDGLTDDQRRMVKLFIEAAEPMDDAFWIQAYGDREALLESVEDPDARRFAVINYGPWDRLAGDEPFVAGVGAKPKGANLYPVDVTKEELEAATGGDDEHPLMGQYTLVRRDESGALTAIPYHEAFRAQVESAAASLREAAKLAKEPGLQRYLELRAEALVTDDFRASDLAWMDMKDNVLDVVIGPIENYEDKIYAAKTSYEAYVLIKDTSWSQRLAKYATMLPDLQRALPVADEYKQETPGTDSDLNAYDVVYYAGDCNAGSKTIAINLPNDEQVQLERGTRRLQLKNAMRAKYDKILLPIADRLIADEQRPQISFEAFFGNTMFHEVAHGLGIKNTLDGKGTVRQSLEDLATALEEGKADVLGLYMVTQLDSQGELEASLESHYVTFLASIFRSIRFGASSAHGKANMVRFNFFQEQGAFSRDEATGTYAVNLEKMRGAVDALSGRILELQGDGNYDVAKAFVDEFGMVRSELQADLDRLTEAGIPVDITFEQGVEVLGL
jgi:hypothetical protein